MTMNKGKNIYDKTTHNIEDEHHDADCDVNQYDENQYDDECEEEGEGEHGDESVIQIRMKLTMKINTIRRMLPPDDDCHRKHGRSACLRA